MPAQLKSIIGGIRRIIRPPHSCGVTDAELLGRFIKYRDEAAFELVVRRHGPMVFSVCRRVLRDTHDTEDAFQATFLTLVRKASSIGKGDSLGSWLYKVAYRIALRARARSARRAAHEKPLGALVAAQAVYTPPDELGLRDLRPVLDAELYQLPEKYRAAIILCYLQGKTNEQAAEELGCPKGTILSRLARGRERLRTRLARRGLAITIEPLESLLAENASSLAMVSPVLIHGTLCMALLVSASKWAGGGVAPSVVELMEGALRDLSARRLTHAATLLLALLLIGTGVGAIAYAAYTPQGCHASSESGTMPLTCGSDESPSTPEQPTQAQKTSPKTP